MTTENKPNLGWVQDDRDIEARERLSDNDARGALTFRKKPVTISAIQWTGENGNEVQAFLHNGHEYAADGWVKGSYVEIGTLEGLMVASIGDWIIRGVKGEHYPCKPDIFAQTYEPADSLPAGDGLTDEQLDKFVADLVEYGTEFVAPLYAVVEQIERTALAAPRQPGEMGAGVQTQDALRWIMRQAESAKEPCSDNPESPAAIRNGKLAGIANAAAQTLGLVRGPSYADEETKCDPSDICAGCRCQYSRAASAQQDEREAFEVWAVGAGLDVLRAAQWANTDYQSLPTEDAWRGWNARGQQVQADAMKQPSYQQLFDAMTAAVIAPEGCAVAISVEKFCDAMGLSYRKVLEARAAQADAGAVDFKALVNRFLTWPVPASVYPDGIPGQPGRTGTNLLSALETEEMLRYVLQGYVPPAAESDKRNATEATDRAIDQAYCDGAKFGWNCCAEGASVRFQQAINARRDAIRESRAAMSREQSGGDRG